MPARRKTTVILTDHAYRRWRERGGGKLTPGMIRRHLLGYLASGAEARKGVIEVPLGNGLSAVCVPELTGCWTVVTIKKSVRHGYQNQIIA